MEKALIREVREIRDQKDNRPASRNLFSVLLRGLVVVGGELSRG